MINVGSADRVVRAIFGLVLLAAPFLPFLAGFFAGWGSFAYIVSFIGVVLIVTAAIRICPLYMLFGFRTCPVGAN